jgi:gamma-glutamylcyclotransferase (GGCT)/AIG2-like uncharacterized protein YtfP
MLEPGLLYFAYGCNMDRDLLARVIAGDPGPARPARVAGWRLAFNKGGEESSGWRVVANLMKAEGCFVYGAVYRLPGDRLKRLDEFEGVPGHYRRATLWIEPVGRRARQAALAYIAQPEWLVTEGEPDPRYLDHLQRGGAAVGCPGAYLDWVRALAHGGEEKCYRD